MIWKTVPVHDRIDTCARMLSQGATHTQVAQLYEDYPSRNAIVGFCKRHNIPSRPLFLRNQQKPGAKGGIVAHATRKANQARRVPKQVSHFNPAFSADGALPENHSPTRAEAWLPLPGSTPLPLEQHRDGMCRWPVQDPALFCCLPVDTGKRYCAAHHRMGFAPLPPRKKTRKAA